MDCTTRCDRAGAEAATACFMQLSQCTNHKQSTVVINCSIVISMCLHMHKNTKGEFPCVCTCTNTQQVSFYVVAHAPKVCFCVFCTWPTLQTVWFPMWITTCNITKVCCVTCANFEKKKVFAKAQLIMTYTIKTVTPIIQSKHVSLDLKLKKNDKSRNSFCR